MGNYNIMASNGGYTPSIDSSTSSPQMGRYSDLYVGAHTGILQFNSSLNSIFGTNVSSIAELGIKSAGIRYRVHREYDVDGPFTIAISNSQIGKGKDFTRTYSQMQVGEAKTYTTKTYPYFYITELFTTANGNSTYLTPNDSIWYLYIKNNQSGNEHRFERFDFVLNQDKGDVYRIYFETYEGTIRYYNGSSWQIATPYYYNGTSWVPCTTQYYNGSSWIQC